MDSNLNDSGRNSGGHVLVVDDEENNRVILRDMLVARGYRVTEAVDGEQALQAASQGGIDTIVLDVMMPALDGFTVCRRLKDDPNTAAVPVLLVTALTDRQDRLAGMEAGANDFVTKPIDIADVMLRVRNAVQSKRLYDQLADNYEKLRELERLRDDLTHMIVHDLRTPMTSLISGLQTMPFCGELNDTQRECLDMAVQSGHTLLGMVNDLLDISKMEDGSLSLNYEDLSAPQLLEQAREQIVPLANEKRLSVETSADQYLPTFTGDAHMLCRTLVNLLGNAVKFTPDGGSVVCTARFSEPEMAILFSVQDTGEGIPREAFDRIFEKFGQVETQRAGQKMSTGLGLTFCKMAVEAHGGRIWVESETGRGSTFSFSVPLEPTAAALAA